MFLGTSHGINLRECEIFLKIILDSQTFNVRTIVKHRDSSVKRKLMRKYN